MIFRKHQNRLRHPSMVKLSKLMNRSKTPRRRDLWIDSETDLSSTSDCDSRNSILHSELFAGQSNENCSLECCLICSIVPSLSHINCCTKHLTLLTRELSTSMAVRCSSSKSPRIQRKKRSLTLKSFVRLISILNKQTFDFSSRCLEYHRYG